MKIIVTGGGGHFSPLFSVIQELSATDKVLIIGRKYALEGDSAISLEYQTAKTLGVSFAAITTARLQRKFTQHTIPSLFKLPVGLFQAMQVLLTFRPQLILSGGSYIALPVVLAATILRIPIVVHEQTLEAGLVNKITAPLATKICISWETSAAFFPKSKTILTGNPIKKEFLEPPHEIKKIYDLGNEQLPLLYVTGGSLGSHAINVLIEGCIEQLVQQYNVFHQTGDAREFNDFERLTKLKESLPEKLQKRYSLTKFVASKDVGSVLWNATLVIARSGMNTVTDLLYYKKPSILIPLPFSQNKEQEKNALFLQKRGLATILSQNSLTPALLYEKITQTMEHIRGYSAINVEKDRKLVENAAKHIVSVLRTISQ